MATLTITRTDDITPLHPATTEIQELDVLHSNGKILQPNAVNAPPPDPGTNSEATRGKLRTVAVVVALFTSLFVSALSGTVVATAVPTICAQLGSTSGYSWIGGAYILANGAAVPIWAKLSDIWGRKPILLSATGGYFLASILCAKSNQMKMLIASRAIQGAFSGGLIQLVYITIGDIFSVRERSLYYGLLQIMWILSSGIGPVMGGAFSQTIGWQWCFWICLPVSGLAFTLLFLFLDVHNPRTQVLDGLKAIDWLGTATMLGFVVMVLLGLDLGGTTYPWDSPRIICLIVFGCVMAGLFLLCEQRYAKYPLIPLDLFRNKATNACLLIGFIFDFVFVGCAYYMPLYYQLIHQASPLRSGLLILPFLVSGSIVGMCTGVYIHRTGHYVGLIRVGQCLTTMGFGLFIQFSATTSLPVLIVCQVVAGVGTGMLFQPPLIAIQASVPAEKQSSATSALGFARCLAISLSIVIGGVVFQNGMSSRGPELRAAGVAGNIVDALTIGAGAAANIDLVAMVTEPAQRAVVEHALAWSMRNMWIMYTAISALGLCAVALLTHQSLSEEHVEVKTGLKQE